jgi:hypothetical protein
MLKSKLTPIVILLAIFLLATPISAQTADSETPAFEAICDGQVGAAYGLCNAYCEAMDCDSDAPQASANACIKVANKFINITGLELPCVQADTAEGRPLAIDFDANTFVSQLLISVETSWLDDPTWWFLDVAITGLNGGFEYHGQDRLAVVDGTVFNTNPTVSEVVFNWTADTTLQQINELYTVCSQVIHIVDGEETLVGALKCADFGPF